LQENREKKYYFDFMVKRFFRIIPTYWFAIFFSVVLFWIFNFSYKSFSIEQILANMFMLQGFFHINHVDGVFWTILIEVKFYIIVFVLGIFGLWKYKNYITLLFAIFCFTVLFYGVLNDKFLANAIWFYLWSMFIGSLFTQESSKLKIFNFSLFVIFLVISLYLVRFEELYKTGIVESWIIGGVIFTLFYNKKWSIRLLSSFGKISYSYYLLHQNTGYLILSLGIFSSFMMNHIFNILITIFISFIVYRYIETPSNQYGKQLIKRKK
jgi:peptidoglycan/LPS O-acetylase OafA/YrhL